VSLDFSRNYSPPGVYIEESDSTLVTPTGIPPTLVALIGPARGYQVNTEQVALSDTDVRLAKEGIDTDSLVAINAATGQPVDAADYTLTKDPTTPTDQNYGVDLTAVADPETPVGTTLLVTYHYTESDYYAPRRCESFEDVKDLYGEPLNTTVIGIGDSSYQHVTSPLSLAAMLAFQNGATEVICCAATPPGAGATTESAKSTARRTALNEAYAKIETDPAINVLVPVTAGIADDDAAGVLTDLRAALMSQVQDGFHRFGIVGFDPGVDTAPDALIDTSGAEYLRMMLAYGAPGGLQMYSGAANSSFAVGHGYLAAAYAGRMAALPIQQALTKQVIAGFLGLAGTPLANSLKNQYSSNGVAVVEQDRNGRLSVRHGVTTDPTNVNTREASVVRAKDSLVTALSEGMNGSQLVGAPLDEDLLLSIKSAVQGILDSAVSDGAIISYADLVARQTGTDPSVVEVKFAYRPAYPLNYIVISFSIDMSTQTTTFADETLA
jgi:hypothetical protein